MKKLFLLIAFFILWSAMALAQTGQVDLSQAPDIAYSQSTGSAPGDFINWIRSFYTFSLIAGVFLAVGVIVWAGLRYALAAGNPSTQQDARDQILQALLGLILLFGAYLILYVINPNLVNLRLEALQGVTVSAPPQERTGGGVTAGWGTGGTFNGQGGTFGGGGATGCENCLTNAEAGQILQQSGVSIKNGVSLEGLRDSSVNGVVNLKQSCGCDVMVTSGTDGVHNGGTFSHAGGYKVDLRLDSQLNNYIAGSFTPIGTRSDGALQYRAPDGSIYAKESDHWDVLFKG